MKFSGRGRLCGGVLSIGPFEVTRSRGGRGSYGKCFWFRCTWGVFSLMHRAVSPVSGRR
jgi:hypothetical protein